MFGAAGYHAAADSIDYFDNQRSYCILVGELERDLNRSAADSSAYRFDTAAGAADIGFGRIVDSFDRCCSN